MPQRREGPGGEMTNREDDSPTAAIPGEPGQATRGKVLVVEDVALIRITTADMAEQIGFDTAQAGDAREALAMLRDDAAIGILLTDLGLPGMSGRELVAEALKLKPGLKVIIASGYSNPDDLPAGVRCLVKPFDMQQLRKALES
jgi:CheY-like chemotaxis protein